jgi:hypothetical protein
MESAINIVKLTWTFVKSGIPNLPVYTVGDESYL